MNIGETITYTRVWCEYKKIIVFITYSLWHVIAFNCCRQYDQIGLLLKSLGDIFCYKINSNIGQLFVQFLKPLIICKNLLQLLLGNFGVNWATFNSSIWSHLLWASRSLSSLLSLSQKKIYLHTFTYKLFQFSFYLFKCFFFLSILWIGILSRSVIVFE